MDWAATLLVATKIDTLQFASVPSIKALPPNHCPATYIKYCVHEHAQP